MSFELIFCTSSAKKEGASSLLAYLKSQPYMQCSQEGDKFEVMYQNPVTGVYGVFYYNPVETSDIPPNWIEKGATGLSVAINYLRPSFFVLELVPVINALCREKNLLMLGPDSIDSSGIGTPK